MDAELRRQLNAGCKTGRKEPVTGTGGMVTASHPIVVRVAVDILRAGGNAWDAALAAAITQVVVEPHMSTITGSLTSISYDAGSGDLAHCCGSFRAPST